MSLLDIGYNALYTSDANLISFLNGKDVDWAQTQTIAPSNIAATPLNSTTINLTWDAITYSADTGGYRVSVGTTSGGPYTFFQQTIDKTTTSLPVTGLNHGTPYYFVISTRTDAHANNQNVVGSENSAEASTTTIPVHTVTFVEGSGGTISGTKVQTVEHGSNCTEVEAVPGSGYHFVYWTGDYSGTTNPLTITNVTANMNITANFAIDAALNLTSPDGGEYWTLGATKNITWTATNYSGTVRLVLFRNGAKLGNIATGLSAAAGSYS